MKKSRRGAASIIVIFMIMVLFVFGMLALTTSLANMRLSNKSTDWLKEFYQVEKTAEDLMFQFDECMEAAEKRARDIITQKRDTISGFTDYQDEFARQYFYFACEELEKLPKEYIESTEIDKNMYMDRETPVDQMLTPLVYFDVSQADSKKHLLISVQAVLPDYKIDVGESVIEVSRADSNQPRFEIIEWREWQVPFKYDEPIQFWSGEINNVQ